MKKNIFTSLLLAGITAFSQNYSVIDQQRTYLYSHTQVGTDYEAVGIKTDSVTGSTDKTYHLSKTAAPISASVYQLNAASWIGPKLVVTNSENADIFYNNDNEAITILRGQPVGASWTAYSTLLVTVKATVLSQTYENTVEGMDSVKTIGFQVYNPIITLLDYQLNDLTIKIGRKAGLIQALNFRDFPGGLKGTTSLRTYTLIGSTTPNVGVQPLDWNKIYDFAVGDEFHTVEDKFSLPLGQNYYDTLKVIAKITAKAQVGDSVAYTVSEQSLSIKNYYLTPVQVVKSTRTYVVKYPLTSTSVAGNFYVSNGTSLHLYEQKYQNDQHRRIETTIGTGYVENNRFYITSSPFGCDNLNVTNYYIAGLGGSYFDLAACATSWNTWTKRLVYYKKGTVESGIALDLDIVTAVSDATLNSQVLVFPNPCQNQLSVSNTSAGVVSVEIMDAMGSNIVATQEVGTAGASINTTHFNNGLYFYTITNNEGKKAFGKFIKE